MSATIRIPEFPCAGGCACSAIRYRLTEDPIELHVCHCTNCQTISGTAFVLSMVVSRRSVEVDQGEPEKVEYDTPDGIHHIYRRCPDCGTRLWSESRTFPETLVLRPGTLDDTSWLAPVAHIWTRSRQPWVEIPDDTLNSSEQPDQDAFRAAVRAWKSRATAAD